MKIKRSACKGWAQYRRRRSGRCWSFRGPLKVERAGGGIGSHRVSRISTTLCKRVFKLMSDRLGRRLRKALRMDLIMVRGWRDERHSARTANCELLITAKVVASSTWCRICVFRGNAKQTAGHVSSRVRRDSHVEERARTNLQISRVRTAFSLESQRLGKPTAVSTSLVRLRYIMRIKHGFDGVAYLNHNGA